MGVVGGFPVPDGSGDAGGAQQHYGDVAADPLKHSIPQSRFRRTLSAIIAAIATRILTGIGVISLIHCTGR